MAQVEQYNLIEESQLDFTKDRGYVSADFYLKTRINIRGFEKMKIKGKPLEYDQSIETFTDTLSDLLQKLIERQEKVIQSRKDEGLLD
jgi:hypothetical protein